VSAPRLAPAVLCALCAAGATAARAADGERLALRHCGRCHVVSEANKFGGIDSTPSFAALRSLADWQDKFAVFWSVSPHRAVMQIEGLTQPFEPDRPPPMAPITLTKEELEAIQEFVATIPPKDLREQAR